MFHRVRFRSSRWLCGWLCVLVSWLPAFGQSERLTLRDAIETALAGHPALRAAAARVDGVEGLRVQAALRPNPVVTLQTENWRFWGAPSLDAGRDLDVFTYLSQPLETAGKRGKRATVAEKDLEAARIEKSVLEWRIRQEVRMAYLRALLAQRQLEIMRENGSYLDQIVEYHRIRVEQGSMAEADLIKVRLERERLGLQENAAAMDAERAMAELLRAMGVPGRSHPLSLAETEQPARSGAPLDEKSLLEKARALRPELRLAEAGASKARAELDYLKAQAKPDWIVSLGYKRTSGFDTLLAGVSVPVPFFNRNQGSIGFGVSEVERSEQMRQAAIRQVESEVLSALGGLRRRRAMLSQMEKGVSERAEESWRISLAAYREGGGDLLRLLDAQRVRAEVRLLAARTRMEYLISLAELEAAAGEENLNLSEEVLRVPR